MKQEIAKEIAKWVIDNRYKSVFNNLSDHEMYHELVLKIEAVSKPAINCSTCRHEDLSKYAEPCYGCSDFSRHQIKET